MREMWIARWRPASMRWMVAALVLLAAGLVVATAPDRVLAEESMAGAVLSVTGGRLEAYRGGLWSAIGRGTRLAHGERLRTDARGVAVLDLPGRGRTVIGPASELTLPAAGAAARVELARGALWLNARLRPGTTLRVTTPLATAGVRGTNFSVIADDDGSAVCTCRGTVEVTLPDSRTVTAGTGRFVPVSAAGTAPRRALADRDLLLAVRGDRYDWCFTCHEVGRRGQLRRGWSAEALGL